MNNSPGANPCRLTLYGGVFLGVEGVRGKACPQSAWVVCCWLQSPLSLSNVDKGEQLKCKVVFAGA